MLSSMIERRGRGCGIARYIKGGIPSREGGRRLIDV